MARIVKPKANPALAHVSNETIECRGDQHDFPRVRIGPLPKGIRAIPQHDGSYQMVISCLNCGRERTRTTLPGGYFERGVRFSYKGGPKDFSAEKDSARSDLGKADYTEELYRRNAENLALAASKATAAARAAEIAASESDLGRALL